MFLIKTLFQRLEGFNISVAGFYERFGQQGLATREHIIIHGTDMVQIPQPMRSIRIQVSRCLGWHDEGGEQSDIHYWQGDGSI